MAAWLAAGLTEATSLMEAEMNEADSKRSPYYLVPARDPVLHSDPDGSQRLFQELALDPVRQLDAALEVTDDADVPRLLGQTVALEAHLNEPYALFPGERDTGGIDVTEYPFG